MNKFKSDIRADRPNNDGKAAFYGYGGLAPFPVTYTPMQAGVFNIYLFGVIEDATQFISAIEVMQQATENDVVYIHLSTDGGSLDATDTFLSAMRECQARVIVKASGGVHSAGTVILLHADEFFLSENFNALIHNGSCGSGGKFSDYVAHSKHTVRYFETVMHNTYQGFLTDEEITQLLNGTDFWMDADEFAERFNARNEIIAAQMEEAQAAYAELVEAAKVAKPTKAKKSATAE
jgi:ATP-dependent protease ClpP protease subunit